MSELKNTIRTLTERLDVPVYSGEVPEAFSTAAVVVQYLSETNARDIEGGKRNREINWRLVVVAPTVVGVESILDTLDTMDNSRNAHYQRIFTTLLDYEPVGLTIRIVGLLFN